MDYLLFIGVSLLLCVAIWQANKIQALNEDIDRLWDMIDRKNEQISRYEIESIRRVKHANVPL